MKPVFADSFYYIAVLNRTDADHARVVEFCGKFFRPIVTTAWILAEVADGMAAVNLRSGFVSFYRQLVTDPTVTIVPPSPVFFDAGMDLYTRRPDKSWSLTDCISFVVMESHGLSDALTADHHFEQAGFTALLK